MARVSKQQKTTDSIAFLKEEGYSVIKDTHVRCRRCGKYKNIKDFYETSNPQMDINGVMSVCKDCSNEILDNYFSVFNNFEKALLYTCEDLDVVYHDACVEAVKTRMANHVQDNKKMNNIFGHYKASLGQNKSNVAGMRFKDSTNKKDDSDDSKRKVESMLGVGLKNKEITEEMIFRWGESYEPDVVIRFEEKYNFLKNNYKEKTNMHTEALLKYVRYSVLEEISTESGDFQKAKVLSGMAKDAATAAKINPSQLSKADLSDGLNTMSELSQAIERAVDIVPILPKFKYRPNDALDFNIWCYVNYERHLRGMPLVDYSDIYNFYDERVEDYIKQYGDPYNIFTNDTTKKNRPNIITFLQDDAEFLDTADDLGGDD